MARPEPVENQRIYRVMGMRRSGNHAVIAWVKQNLKYDNYLFVNECTAGRDPTTAFTEIEFNDDHIGQHNMDRTKALMLASKAPECDTIIFSYEDPRIKGVFDRKQTMSGKYEKKIRHNIVLYREFLNWLASYHALQTRRMGSENNSIGRIMVLFTGIYAWMEAVKLVHSPEFATRSDFVAVQYDDWFKSADYRAELAAQLALDHRDMSLPALSQYGGGSSFDNGKSPDELRIDQRWQKMRGNPNFREILRLAMADPALNQLLKKRFPETRETIFDGFGF